MVAAACFALGTALAAQETRGVVRGVVTFEGEVAGGQVPVSQHQDVCGPTVPDQHLRVNDGRVANALVVLDYQGTAEFAETTVTLENSECDFQPSVQVAPPGARLVLRNGDPISHTMMLEHDGRELGIVELKPDQQKKNGDALTQPGLLEVSCVAHEWMHARIWVLPHPYYAITDDKGRFQVGLIPSGRYILRVWHEQLGVLEREIVIEGNETVAANFRYDR
jgi:hypothetical protein